MWRRGLNSSDGRRLIFMYGLAALLFSAVVFMVSCSVSGERLSGGSATEAAGGEAALDEQAPSAADNTVIAWIDGEPVVLEEFRVRMLEHRGTVIVDFGNRFGSDAGQPDFWLSSYDGEIPLEELKRQTLDIVVKIKVQQIAARDAGIADHIDYASFLAELAEENRQRKARADKGEVIFGPKQYSEKAFFHYKLANQALGLRRVLAEDGGHADALMEVGQYEEWLEGKIHAAEVVKNPPVYEQLTMPDANG